MDIFGGEGCALFSYHVRAVLIPDGPLIRMEEEIKPDSFLPVLSHLLPDASLLYSERKTWLLTTFPSSNGPSGYRTLHGNGQEDHLSPLPSVYPASSAPNVLFSVYPMAPQH